MFLKKMGWKKKGGLIYLSALRSGEMKSPCNSYAGKKRPKNGKD